MANKGINFKFNGAVTPISSYDQNKTNLGSLIKQYSGGTNADNYAGPEIIGIGRPMEQSTPIAGAFPFVISYSPTVDWVFLVENSTAGNTRRVMFYEYYRESSIFNWKGFITLTYSTASAHTVRGFRVIRNLYTSGTVGVSTTTVTGVGSNWNTDRMSVGSRIGFGSTDPTQITTWYEISSVGSDTSITLTSSAGSISSGTPYVIEDMLIITTTTNVTLTNGGLYVTKGIRPEIFTPIGTTIPAATTVDRIRAVYWLADASTVNNTTACGSAIGDMVSWVDQSVYVLNSTGAKVFVYNFRKALTLASGKDITTLTISTGNQALTGTISVLNNGRVGTLFHGPGNGIESLYFATTTRIYRCSLTDIVNGSTTWTSDAMVEVPPGGTTTYLATNAMSSCEIATDIDRLVIPSTGAAGVRSYVTQYNTTSNPFNHIFLNDDKQQDISTSDSGGVIHPSILASTYSVWSENGRLYLARLGTTSALNQIYTLPISSHQTYAFTNNQLLITPKFDISDSNKLYNVSVKNIPKLGTDTFSLPTEPFKTYYRTTGISDNSGGWTQLDEYGDLSGVSGTEIQFCIIFKILGTTCVPSRIMGLNLSYEDNTTDSHYEPSVGNSSIPNRIFSYRQGTSWGSIIPNLRIRLYNATTGALVLDDNLLSSTFGVFEYSTNGGTTWLAWDSSADVVGNYIRYTATSLPSGVRIRSLLTQM
jgi:hypothetical protein